MRLKFFRIKILNNFEKWATNTAAKLLVLQVYKSLIKRRRRANRKGLESFERRRVKLH